MPISRNGEGAVSVPLSLPATHPWLGACHSGAAHDDEVMSRATPKGSATSWANLRAGRTPIRGKLRRLPQRRGDVVHRRAHRLGGAGIGGLELLEHFAAEHNHAARRLDANLHPIALDGQDSNGDVIADNQALFTLPAQDEHPYFASVLTCATVCLVVYAVSLSTSWRPSRVTGLIASGPSKLAVIQPSAETVSGQYRTGCPFLPSASAARSSAVSRTVYVGSTIFGSATSMVTSGSSSDWSMATG